METIENIGPEIETVFKKGRHRKKQLFNSILHQMEFYFSDSNLSKDRFLSQLISEDPCIDLNVFLKFNKIRKLTTNLDDIRKAVSKSELIELTEDKEKIFRKKPITYKRNVDECTLYVERLKMDATHEWLSSIFSEFGKVVYVSIPKYKHKVNKGFAFIEFENEKDAKNAVEYFDSIGCKMSSQTDPKELQSIITFEGDGAHSDCGSDQKVESLKGGIKSKAEPDKLEITDINSAEDNNYKKRKLSSEDESLEKKSKVDSDDKLANDISETEEIDIKKKKKLKKEHKRKNYLKHLELKVLPKQEWKKIRNKYLDLQRKKMQEFKLYLHRAKFCHKTGKSINCSPHTKCKQDEETPSKLEYTPGVIVKVKLTEPCMDAKKLKNDIKFLSKDIQYVDVPLPAGSEEVFIRFRDNQNAKAFCNQEFAGELTLLSDEEEKKYWQKIQNDRQVKFARCTKKQRGREKLLKKAEKEMVKHIRFDECERSVTVENNM